MSIHFTDSRRAATSSSQSSDGEDAAKSDTDDDVLGDVATLAEAGPSAAGRKRKPDEPQQPAKKPRGRALPALDPKGKRAAPSSRKPVQRRTSGAGPSTQATPATSTPPPHTSATAICSPRSDKEILASVTNMHKDAKQFKPLMDSKGFMIDVRKISDPKGMLKIRAFDPARITNLFRNFFPGSLTPAKVLFDDNGKDQGWSQHKKHKSLQVF